MESSLHGNNCFAAKLTIYEVAFVPHCGGYRESRDVGVRNYCLVLNPVCQFAQSAAKHYSGDRSLTADNTLDIVGAFLEPAGVDFLIFHIKLSWFELNFTEYSSCFFKDFLFSFHFPVSHQELPVAYYRVDAIRVCGIYKVCKE